MVGSTYTGGGGGGGGGGRGTNGGWTVLVSRSTSLGKGGSSNDSNFVADWGGIIAFGSFFVEETGIHSLSRRTIYAYKMYQTNLYLYNTYTISSNDCVSTAIYTAALVVDRSGTSWKIF